MARIIHPQSIQNQILSSFPALPFCQSSRQTRLDHEALDLVLEGTDLVHEVGGLVGGDGSGNDGAGDTAGTAESHLGGNVDVRDVLVLAEKRKVHENGEGSGVGSEEDDLRSTTVEGLGGLVGTCEAVSDARFCCIRMANSPFFNWR